VVDDGGFNRHRWEVGTARRSNYPDPSVDPSRTQAPERRVKTMQQSFGLKKTTAALALMLSVGLISAYFVAVPVVANAQTAVSQCNGIDNQGGREVRCSYTVTNNLNGNQMSSTIHLEACTGFANDEPTMVCISPPDVTAPTLVTSIEQCNGSGSLGGWVECSVTVINNITSTETPLAATVNQCVNSGLEGGAEPLLCDPYQSTTDATITQCNGSGNGGGATGRVRCTVASNSTTTTALTVTINQCNGSANGGGSEIVCFASITNNMTAPAAPPDDDDDDDNSGSSNGSGGSGGSATPTPTPAASPTPAATPPTGPSGEDGLIDLPAPDVTPQPLANPVRPNIPGLGTSNGARENGGGSGGGTTGNGALTNTGLGTGGSSSRGDADEITTNQISRVPRGGAATGGGSSNGIENLGLLVVGLVLMAASLPALFVRRRVSVKA
jgi:hypothetical protein